MVAINFFVNPDEVSGDIRVTQGSFLTGTSDSHASGLDAAAIDLGLAAGTDIYPFASGRVVGAYSGYTDAAFPTAPTTGPATFSNYVTVEYSLPGPLAPFYVTYAHLSQATAGFWVNQLNAAGSPVSIESGTLIGEVAGPSETRDATHLHMSFAVSYGNYSFPNGIAEATASPPNGVLLSQLSIGDRDLSSLVENDYIPSTPLSEPPSSEAFVVLETEAVLSFDGVGFDATRVYHPTSVTVEDTEYLYYAGLPFNNRLSVGVATTDGGDFVKLSDTDALISNFGSTPFTNLSINPVRVFYDEESSLWTMYFGGQDKNLITDNGTRGFGIATSQNGFDWDLQQSPLLAETGPGEGYTLNEIVRVGGQYVAYVTDVSPNGSIEGISTSADGVNFTPLVDANYSNAERLLTATEYGNGIIALFRTADNTVFQTASSEDGINFTNGQTVQMPDVYQPSDMVVDGEQVKIYASHSVGNVNWSYTNIVTEAFYLPVNTFNASPSASGDTLVFFDDFERPDNTVVGNGWVELNEAQPEDPAYTGSSTLNVVGGRLEINFDTEGNSPRTATKTQPYMKHALPMNIADSGFEISYTFQPNDEERPFHFVGLADSSAGEYSSGSRLHPSSGIGVELIRSDYLISNSGIRLLRFDGDRVDEYDDPTDEELIVWENTSFQFENTDQIDVSFRMEADGRYTLTVSNGTETDIFSGATQPLTETLDEVVVSTTSAGFTFYYQDNSEILRFDDLAVYQLGGADPILQNASSLELEYFARQSAYGYSPYLSDEGDSVLLSSTDSLLNLLSGWVVSDVFEYEGDTFRAVVLTKEGFAPVLAVRGTLLSPQDWLENTPERGVGIDEVERAISSDLAGWLTDPENAGFTITGHSQGGAQAQLLALWAAREGNTPGQVVTFNAAGITLPLSIGNETFTLADINSLVPMDAVQHFVSRDDLISQVGDSFLPGTVNYYDTPIPVNGAFPFGFILQGHTGHWAQSELYSIAAEVGYETREVFLSSENLSTAALSDSGFSHIQSVGSNFDDDYQNFVDASVAFFSSHPQLGILLSPITGGVGPNRIREILSSRQASEDARTNELANLIKVVNAVVAAAEAVVAAGEQAPDALWVTGDDALEIGAWFVASLVDVSYTTGDELTDFTDDLVEIVRDVSVFAIDGGIDSADAFFDYTRYYVVESVSDLISLGNFIRDSFVNGLDRLIETADDAFDWISARFESPDDIVVAQGTNPDSTPAVVLDRSSGEPETLSSSSGNSIFLLTDPDTEVVQTGGNNIVWGFAADFDGTNVIGDVSTTDSMFVQNEFFNTEDMARNPGSAIINVDLNQDGEGDITITWEGNYRLESIVAEQGVDGTYIRYLGNTLPEATSDLFSTTESQPFTTGNVLANDTDGDGDVLSFSGLDIEGTQGIVIDNGDGTFKYDPNGAFDDLREGETATDTFGYFVSDGVDTVRGEVTVTITGEDHPDKTEKVDIDFIKQGPFGRTIAEVTVTQADGTSQTDTETLGWFSRKIGLNEAEVKITSGGPGHDVVSAIYGGLGVSSRADGFSFKDRLDIDRKESLKLSLVDEDQIATRLLLDFAEQEGDVQLVFFNDGERVAKDTFSYDNGILELTDLAFDKVKISGSGRDDVRITGIEFDRIEEADFWIGGVDSFDFV
ncbi:cadherin-like domain-containing protein [Ruegeria sp. Alg231-54]|uniref:cadherin-like domain-containing protein n=1 Tax=Ruegeria sp. Alg231-54 TaxID=1922221 RepID=UPI0018FF4AD7|nr:cadherin-like domain-containing protein [Ruegeria sp. Alg231-54]